MEQHCLLVVTTQHELCSTFPSLAKFKGLCFSCWIWFSNFHFVLIRRNAANWAECSRRQMSVCFLRMSLCMRVMPFCHDAPMHLHYTLYYDAPFECICSSREMLTKFFLHNFQFLFGASCCFSLAPVRSRDWRDAGVPHHLMRRRW